MVKWLRRMAFKTDSGGIAFKANDAKLQAIVTHAVFCIRLLDDLYPQCIHVRDMNLREAEDIEV